MGEYIVLDARRDPPAAQHPLFLHLLESDGTPLEEDHAYVEAPGSTSEQE